MPFSAGRPVSVFTLHKLSCIPRVAAYLLAVFTVLASAQTKPVATPFTPPAFPLAVRSPYHNAWLRRGNNLGSPGLEWPTIWTSVSPNIVGWYIAIRVDDQGYVLMGQAPPNDPPAANLTATLFTPTKTVFSYVTGPMNVNLSFLNPFESGDLVRQSLPFSYFYIDATSPDGSKHDFSVYADISAEWVTGDDNQICNWTSSSNGDTVFHSVSLQTPQAFAEVNDHPMDATAYIGMSKQEGITWKIDSANASRTLYTDNGELDNNIDTAFRAVQDNFPVFAISVNVSSISSTSDSIVWALGVVRDPAIQYTTPNNAIQHRRSYFWSQLSTPQAIVEFILNDYKNALASAAKLDQQLQSAALAYSSQYSDLVSMSVVFAMGASDITISTNSDGTLNTSDVLVFAKNIGDVASTGVNRVDNLYPMMPAYLYLDPALFGYILESLLRYQEPSLGLYPNPYAALDLGAGYPNATGDSQEHPEGIETSADMLIMVLAQAQASGNGSLIKEHYDLLKSWGQYLVQNALAPGSQVTSDQLPTTNQTNLALKGIIGIGAMSKISDIVGAQNDSHFFQNISQSYIAEWSTLASNGQSESLMATYGNQSSSGLMYNMYADKQLQLGLIPPTLYEQQATFYAVQLASPGQFGITVDSAVPGRSRSDWMLLAAASVPDASKRNLMVSQVHAYAAVENSISPFQDRYNATNGAPLGGAASPGQGAMFSLLSVNQTIKDIGLPNGSTGGASDGRKAHKVQAGVIAGAVVAAVLGIAAIAAGVLFFIRYRHRHTQGIYEGNYAPSFIPSTASESVVAGDDAFPKPGQTQAGYGYTSGEDIVSPSLLPSESDVREVHSRNYSVTYHSASDSVASSRDFPPSTPGLDGTFGFSRPTSTHTRQLSGDIDQAVRVTSAQTAKAAEAGLMAVQNNPYGRSPLSQSVVGNEHETAPSPAAASRDGLLPQADAPNEDIRLEMANLRLEVERLREEQREQLQYVPQRHRPNTL